VSQNLINDFAGAKLQNLTIPHILQNHLNRSKDETECEIILRYRVKAEGNVQYKWESLEGNLLNIKQKPKQTTSPDLFRGVYADIPQVVQLKRTAVTCSSTSWIHYGNSILVSVLCKATHGSSLY